MTPKEYRSIDHAVPYIIDISCPPAHLVYVGTHHINDPQHVEARLIEHLWSQLDPEIAFNEGGNPPTLDDRDEAIRKHGEPGLVRFLAARYAVPVRSIDPRRSELLKGLRRRFTPEQIKTFWLLQQVHEHRRNPYEPLEVRMERVFRNLNPLLPGPPHTLAELPIPEMKDSWFDPMETGHWTNDLALAGNDIRDHFMIEQLVAEVQKGKRVFAVVGASHVPVQERLLRSRTCR